MHIVAGGIKLNNFENEEETRFFIFWGVGGNFKILKYKIYYI